MSDDFASDLLQRGLTAMDTGDNETALLYLRQAVEEDPDLLEAWEALAKLEENPVDQLTALQNVLRLDPDNKEANKALNKLDKKQRRGQQSKTSTGTNEEWIPGIRRRELRNAIVGLAIFTLVIFGAVFVLISIVTGQREAREAEQVAAEMRLTNVQETFAAEAIATETQRVIDDANATQTQLALTTPTFTPSPTSVLPPTFTPTTEATEVPLRQYSLPPDNVTGRLFAWGGQTASSIEYLDLREYSLDTGEFTEILNTTSSSFDVDATGTYGVYESYLTAQDLTNIYRINLTDPTAEIQDLAAIYGRANIFGAFQPSISGDGNKVVFIGSSLDSGRDTVIMLDMTTEQLVVISRDQADYRYPTISQDGNYIAAVRETDEGDVDLVLFDLTRDLTETGFVMVDLTIDGGSIVEAYPTFSADMSLLAYSAAASTSPQNHEIFLIGLENGRPTSGNITVAASEANEIYPVFSPGANFIAYSANDTRSYNIYVRDLTSTTLYQLTDETGNEFPGDWIEG